MKNLPLTLATLALILLTNNIQAKEETSPPPRENTNTLRQDPFKKIEEDMRKAAEILTQKKGVQQAPKIQKNVEKQIQKIIDMLKNQPQNNQNPNNQNNNKKNNQNNSGQGKGKRKNKQPQNSSKQKPRKKTTTSHLNPQNSQKTKKSKKTTPKQPKPHKQRKNTGGPAQQRLQRFMKNKKFLSLPKDAQRKILKELGQIIQTGQWGTLPPTLQEDILDSFRQDVPLEYKAKLRRYYQYLLEYSKKKKPK
ncbi:MAG: hypothetical protein D6805_07030 [Planctomycetota bacterium]|nr:MAG: hypothetical protein D6805_07030 [Planctomycetota bacterium]